MTPDDQAPLQYRKGYQNPETPTRRPMLSFKSVIIILVAWLAVWGLIHVAFGS